MGSQAIFLLLRIGVYLTLCTRFIQVKGFPQSIRILSSGKGRDETEGQKVGDVSPIQTLAVSLATVIGEVTIVIR